VTPSRRLDEGSQRAKVPALPAPKRGLVLGVDGGNTKTVALVARTDGEIVGVGRGGCADIYNAGEQAVENIVSAVLDAGAGPFAAAAFSLAGVDWPEDVAFHGEVLPARIALERPPFVVNDAIGGLRAGTRDGVGVAVVCGSAAAVGAGAPGRRFWHASWWLDLGGAGQLGEQAVRAITRAELGLDPPTALAEAALAFTGLDSVEELLHAVTAREPAFRVRRGRLAPLILDAADAGEPVALEIVESLGRGLGRYAAAAANRVGLDPSGRPLVLAGSVFRHPSPVLADAVAAELPTAVPTRSAFEPAVGALLLAFDELGFEPDLDVLRASLPDRAVYEGSPA
jgi:N-acetylglucosamine kinase-like BadF-type ATPase